MAAMAQSAPERRAGAIEDEYSDASFFTRRGMSVGAVV